jgi:hypothetical protein
VAIDQQACGGHANSHGNNDNVTPNDHDSSVACARAFRGYAKLSLQRQDQSLLCNHGLYVKDKGSRDFTLQARCFMCYPNARFSSKFKNAEE